MRLFKKNFLNWATFIFANNPDMYLGFVVIFNLPFVRIVC